MPPPTQLLLVIQTMRVTLLQTLPLFPLAAAVPLLLLLLLPLRTPCHRAITFDPDGQNMYCASPSGLRRWSWDNDNASARLEAMGDVPWGKVGAGALHYNADGRQVTPKTVYAPLRVSTLPPRGPQQWALP